MYGLILGLGALFSFYVTETLPPEGRFKLAIAFTLLFPTISAFNCFIIPLINLKKSVEGKILLFHFLSLLLVTLARESPYSTACYAVMAIFPYPAFVLMFNNAVYTGWASHEGTDTNSFDAEFWMIGGFMVVQISVYWLLASRSDIFGGGYTRNSCLSPHRQPLVKELGDHIGVCIRGATKSFKNVQAVNIAELDIPKDEIFCLLGQNGAGKSTLLNLITGYLPADRGSFLVKDEGEWRNISPGMFGYCPQDEVRFSQLTVLQNMEIMAELRDQSKSAALEALTLVGLEDTINLYPYVLSGGMRRRLTIALALVGNSPLLILDEPTSGLDPTSRRQLLIKLKEIRKNRTIIVTTHNMEEVEAIAGRVSIMVQGEIVNYPSVEVLKQNHPNYRSLGFSPESIATVRSIFAEVLPDFAFDQGVKNNRVPLNCSLPPSTLRSLFVQLEHRLPPTSYFFDSASLQDAFVNEHSTYSVSSTTSVHIKNAINGFARAQRQPSKYPQTVTFFLHNLRQSPKSVVNWSIYLIIPAVFAQSSENIMTLAGDLFFYLPLVAIFVTIDLVGDRLKGRFRWMRANGGDMKAYFLSYLAVYWLWYCLAIFIMTRSGWSLESAQGVREFVVPLYASGFPLLALVILASGIWSNENSSVIIFFGSYYAFQFIGALLVRAEYTQNDILSGIILLLAAFDPVWNALFPLMNNSFDMVSTPLVKSPLCVTITQIALGIFYMYLVFSKQDKIIKNHNAKNQEVKSVPRPDVENSQPYNHMETQQCVKKYYQRPVVKDLNLPLLDGQIQALVGPNGAGKSTTMNLLSCEIQPDEGSVKFWQPVVTSDLFLEMGFCPQERDLWHHLTLEEHFDMICRIKGITLSYADMTTLLSGFAIDKPPQTPFRELSGGTQRKLLLILSLLGSPRVKLLDEPTSGVDPVTRYSIWQIIKGLKHNSSTLVSTHSMEEAEVLCDKISIMADGCCVYADYPQELRRTFENSYEFVLSSVDPENVNSITTELLAAFPGITQVASNDPFTLIFKIPRDQQCPLSLLFHMLSQWGIPTWSLKKVSFQGVYLSLLRQYETPNPIGL
eukprot:CAMPEP_0115031814 /NCGR_PEP_ID=MMETSP0216-20121206/38781_1 /TAXON_ID=223996 /ORGANISM="Protocruzia adherens, Strain Boccale" /LENGTH=1069 /DNA_ID=CAMNT_0002409583 /DNA_START=371 /DNA_END=3580 /DNA_ORIENTATION=+